MKIQSYYLGAPVEGICKQNAIWVTEGNVSPPLIYLKKPKKISKDKWDEICKYITLNLPRNYEI